MSDPSPDTAPRIVWRRRDDSGWDWGYAHTLSGPCPACPDDTPDACPRCGGRLHRDPIAYNGLSYAYLCQDERTDREGHPQRTRGVPSAAQVRAKWRRKEEEQRATLDRWFKGAVMLWLMVGTVVTVGGLLVALVSMVVYDR